jgi:DNA polymerase-3 subunit gamma/tau
MSYLVFALKWRPKNFDEIVGQKNISTTLKNAIVDNRLANAYLFSGPRGVGKTSTARILAKALNCQSGLSANPCGKCSSCLDIAAGRSLDVIEIDGASNRGIDEIRTLRENVKFAPVQGKYKVYIIDEVHQITPEGFNALLKTLEEPPEFVKFIFATTHPHKVPSTILSRCQHLDFRRIAVLEIIGLLEKIIAAEKLKVDKDVLLAIARSSDGSLRDAESMLDQLISFAQDKISLKDVISMLGIVEQEALFDLADKIVRKDAKGALLLFNQAIDSGKDINTFLQHIIEHFRNLMIAKVTSGDSGLIDLPQEVCVKLTEQARSFSLEEVFSAFNIFVNTQEMTRRFDSIRIPLEIALVKLTHDKKGATAEILNPVKPVILKTENPPVIKVEKKEEINSVIVTLENVKQLWNNLITNLSSVKMSVATYLNEGELAEIKNNILLISFPKNYSLHKEALERKENKEIIEKNISQLLGVSIRVNFLLSTEEKKLKSDIKEDTFIKSALDMFNGRVVREQ